MTLRIKRILKCSFKVYAASQEETRYSPAECVGCERIRIMGVPDPRYISTSYVERQNLTMRMGMRRFIGPRGPYRKRC
jgi:hypothetical protein